MALAVAVAACLLLGVAQALYSTGGPVQILDSSNLKSKLKSAGGLMLVEVRQGSG